jgi:manganese catalase
MLGNVSAESRGRVLATRLYNMTNDRGMKQTLLIGRDTVHQQRLAAIEDMGGLSSALPVPNSFPQEQEKMEFSYTFLNHSLDGVPPPEGRWSKGHSMDGRGEFALADTQPLGEEPWLSMPEPDSGRAQAEQFAPPEDGVRRPSA